MGNHFALVAGTGIGQIKPDGPTPDERDTLMVPSFMEPTNAAKSTIKTWNDSNGNAHASMCDARGEEIAHVTIPAAIIKRATAMMISFHRRLHGTMTPLAISGEMDTMAPTSFNDKILAAISDAKSGDRETLIGIAAGLAGKPIASIIFQKLKNQASVGDKRAIIAVKQINAIISNLSSMTPLAISGMGDTLDASDDNAPTTFKVMGEMDSFARQRMEIGRRLSLKRLAKRVGRGIAKAAKKTVSLPGRAGNILAAGAKRVGMAPAVLLAKLRSRDTKRKQALVTQGIIKYAKLYRSDQARGGKTVSWDNSVAIAKAKFAARGLPVSRKIGDFRVSGQDDIGAPPGILKYLLWLNPLSWFAASVRHTINQFKPEYGVRPGEEEGTRAARYDRPGRRAGQEEPSEGEPAEEEPAEEEPAEESVEGFGKIKPFGNMKMDGLRWDRFRKSAQRFKMDGITAARMSSFSLLAAQCARGNPVACARLRIMRRRAARGDRRSATAVHAIDLIRKRGLAGVAGDATGFVPVAAFAAAKYGPKVARFAMKNPTKIAKADKLVTQADQGDKKAQTRLALIHAGAKAGDPEMKQASAAVAIAAGHKLEQRKEMRDARPWATVKQD